MSRYLARLVGRAQPPALAPAPPSAAGPRVAEDPFEATAPLALAAPPPPALPAPVPLPSGQAPSVPPRAPSLPELAAPRAHETVETLHGRPMPTVEPRPSRPAATPRAAERPPIAPAPSAPPPVALATEARVKREPHAEAGPVRLGPPLPPPVTPIVVERTSQPLLPREDAALAEAAAELTPAWPVAETTRREPRPLAPPPSVTPAPVGQEPDGPRLVIGRMRVDVVAAPSPAPAAAPAVRIVERPAPAERAPTLRSSLRFGLGQM